MSNHNLLRTPEQQNTNETQLDYLHLFSIKIMLGGAGRGNLLAFFSDRGPKTDEK